MLHPVLRWARGHWPLAALLVIAMQLDLWSAGGLPEYSQEWALPSSVLLGAVALAAGRGPVAAAVAASVVLVLSSVVLRVAGVAILGTIASLADAELGAAMAIVLLVFRHRPRRTAVPVLGLLVAAGATAGVLRGELAPFSGDLLLDLWLPAAVVVLLPVTAGWHLRSRDREQERTMRAAVAAAQQRERAALARELHEVVAHHVGGIVGQARSVRSAADGAGPERVLPLIEAAGTDALSAMRRMVVTLRGDDADGAGSGGAPATTADLTADLRAVTAGPDGGLPVRLTLELAEPVPGEVATSVVRIVREAVGNARRHAAGASAIDVLVRAGDGAAHVSVGDDGRAAGVAGAGFGLIGLRERVQLLGGTFAAGERAAGGWQVTATLPLHQGS